MERMEEEKTTVTYTPDGIEIVTTFNQPLIPLLKGSKLTIREPDVEWKKEFWSSFEPDPNKEEIWKRLLGEK